MTRRSPRSDYARPTAGSAFAMHIGIGTLIVILLIVLIVVSIH
jgi:hypothetical protein